MIIFHGLQKLVNDCRQKLSPTACSRPILYGASGDRNDSDLKKVFEKPEAFPDIRNLRTGKKPVYFSNRNRIPTPEPVLEKVDYEAKTKRLLNLYHTWYKKAFTEISQLEHSGYVYWLFSRYSMWYDKRIFYTSIDCDIIENEIDKMRNFYHRYRAINYLKRYGKVEHESKP